MAKKPTVIRPAIEGRIERLESVLDHQAQIVAEVTDAGNDPLPGFIAVGMRETILWTVDQLKAIRGIAAKSNKAAA